MVETREEHVFDDTEMESIAFNDNNIDVDMGIINGTDISECGSSIVAPSFSSISSGKTTTSKCMHLL
jgi:hypothetical protein